MAKIALNNEELKPLFSTPCCDIIHHVTPITEKYRYFDIDDNVYDNKGNLSGKIRERNRNYIVIDQLMV